MSGLRLCHQGHANPLSSRFCNQCGASLTDGAEMIERIVGDRYRILRDIGHGGFGQTYLAEDINRFNEHCVLKELAPAAENQESLDKAKELFAREAEVLYKLQHPQIPRFREWFVEPTRQSMFLVQDYVEGPTYHDILRDRERQQLAFSASEVVTVLMQLLPVLSYIHGRGVVHRDLSPDNLICRNRDRLPVLIDFGGVKEVTVSAAQRHLNKTDEEPAANVTLIGKTGYSPEEQLRRGQVSAASDLYALGVTALVLLIGKDPADFYDAFHLKFNWQDKAKVSPGLAAILDKMVAHKVSERYATADEVLQDLSNLSTLSPPTTPQPDWIVTPASDWTILPALNAAPATVGSAQTLVVAPMGTAIATQVTLPSQQRAVPNLAAPLVAVGRGITRTIWGVTTGLLRSLLMLALFIGMGALGWAGVRWWLESQQFLPSPQPSSTSQPTQGQGQEQEYSQAEQQRKAQLLSRLERSGLSSNFFYRLTNEAYFRQYPDQRGRSLGSGPEDAPLRSNWDQVGNQVLTLTDTLSSESRDRLGHYTERDRTQLARQLRTAQVDISQFDREVTAKLTDVLPMYRNVDLRNTAAFQVWQAIAEDRLPRIRPGL